MKSKFTAWTGALVLGTFAGVGYGADGSDIRAELDALKSQVQDQQSEIQRLRSASGESWLNERRSEEVRALVHEVIGDADTRASFQEGGLTAGHRDHFFIASDDGNFLLNVSGQVQTRYIYNKRRDSVATTIDPDGVERRSTSGFEVRRAKLGFHGHIFDPRLTYGIRGNFAPTRGFASDFGGVLTDEIFVGQRDGFRLEEAWFGYEFADGWQVKVGQFKAPFLREELVYSAHQLAVERSFTSEILSAGYAQGAQLSYTADMFRASVMLHDGSRSANTGWDRTAAGGAVDFAVAGRGEILLAGNWAQFADFTTWQDDELGLMIGAGANYENAAGGAEFQANDVLRWTVDASIEVPEAAGLNAFAAIVGNHPQGRDATIPAGATNFDHVDQWGVVAQAGIFAVPDKMDVFVRWEYLDLMDRDLAGFDDDAFTRKAHTLTAGTNYYMHGHAAKASLDLVWHLDPVPVNAPGTGVLASEEDDQFAVRAQFQFLF
ncbi:MAG: porin [Phycisphaeraceae bacterium]